MSASFNIALILKATDQMSAVVNGAMNSLTRNVDKTRERIALAAAGSAAFGRSSIVAGAAAGAAMLAPLKAFSDLETASTDLKIAMMDSMGRIPPQFEAINKQAIQLGNTLPGTTADFLSVARALQEQGVAMDTVLNGGLKSASHLAVLLKLPGAEAATMVAKLREAYGLADNELEKMADLTQRAKNAFGLMPQDLVTASSYSGATQNILGLKGIENAKRLVALQGLGAGVGLEGSSWGTNVAMMFNRMADSKDRLAKTSKEMKAVNAQLKDAGINLEFFNAQGKFVGVDEAVRQLEKLNKLKDVDKLNVLKRLFGTEASRTAAIIGGAGTAGYNEALARLDRQASLQQRIQLSLTTMKSSWEALTGTAVNALAQIGGPMAEILQPWIQRANAFIGGPMMTWIEQHRRLVGLVGVGVIAFAGLAVGVGAAALAFSGLLRGANMALGLVRGLAMLGRGGATLILGFVRGLAMLGRGAAMVVPYLVRFAGVLGGALITGLRLAAQAVMILGRAMLLNPIGLLVTGIAVAAYLVYKHWATIKAAIQQGYNWIKGMVGPFFSAGAALIEGLVNGIKSRIAQAKAAILEAAAAVKESFTSLLGIHSPSTVFMGYGANLAAGAALGMQAGMPKIQRASHMMATASLSSYGPVAMPSSASRFGAGGGMVVTFAPTINVQGGGDVAGQVRAAMDDAYRDFEANMRRYERERSRRALG